MKDGQALGVRGTPTIFLNGEQLRSLDPADLRARAGELAGVEFR